MLKIITNKQEELENLIKKVRINKELESLSRMGAVHNSVLYDKKVFHYIENIAKDDKSRLLMTEKYLSLKEKYLSMFNYEKLKECVKK